MTYVESEGTIEVAMESEILSIPVVPGVLKHLTTQQLRPLLHDVEVLRKYTLEAIRVCRWQILRQFPNCWLKECLPAARISAERREAIEFLLAD